MQFFNTQYKIYQSTFNLTLPFVREWNQINERIKPAATEGGDNAEL